MNSQSTSSDFTQFLCWDIAEAQRVLDVDALAVDPAVFRAVHFPVAFIRHDSLPNDAVGAFQAGEGYAYDEEKFFNDLSDNRSAYQLVSVIGPSGAGKSHLIRWLYIRFIEARETLPARVILVPRAGTNLQAVLRMILEGMEGDQFRQFRDRLSQSGEAISPEVGRSRLLDGLAERIEHGDPGTVLEALSEHPSNIVKWVCGSAPAFLRDVVFRREWLRPEGALTRMYDMALGAASEVDRVEERRGFTEADLPVDIDPRKVGEAAQESQLFYKQLQGGNEAIKTVLLAVLNHYLDDAIRTLLNVSSEDLGNLLREVRRALAREGKELILFIEDIARLQGIDRQLLDALLERPDSGAEEPLCSLRAVVGCTTGYFETLPNTFRTRCTFVVDLADQRGVDQDEGIVAMASRYLNAARLGRDKLAEWHRDPTVEVPSACDSCPYRTQCHAAFGATGDYGHYPFNATALKKLYSRTNTGGRLNPRFLINDVLRRTLLTNAEKIQNGIFPDGLFHSGFGGMSDSWRASDVERLNRQVGRGTTAERYRALLDLWSSDTELHAGVYEAFGLKSLGQVGQLEQSSRIEKKEADSSPQRSEPAPSHTDSDPEHAVRRLLEALDGWVRGNELGQQETNDLRGYLYEAIRARLDWDAARLLPGQFSERTGTNKPFTRASINFEGQVSKPRPTEIGLKIPLPGRMEKTKVALGLQGIIRYRVHGSWDFPDAIDQFRYFAQLVEELSIEVENTLRKHTAVPFEPAVAAAELLALGAQLHGLPSATKNTPEERIDAWYQDWPTSDGTADWLRLLKDLADSKEELNKVLEAYSLCAKGGTGSTKWFDAVQFDRVLRRRDVVPKEPLPSDGINALPRRLRFIGVLRNTFNNTVEKAIEAECQWWKEWSSRIEGDLGEFSFTDIRDNVTKARNDLEKRGIPYLDTSAADMLLRLSRGLNASEVERTRSLARNIGATDKDNLGAVLRDIGYANTLRSTAKRTVDYLDLVDRLCQEADTYLMHQLGILEGGQSATVVQKEIEENLTILENALLDSEE